MGDFVAVINDDIFASNLKTPLAFHGRVEHLGLCLVALESRCCALIVGPHGSIVGSLSRWIVVYNALLAHKAIGMTFGVIFFFLIFLGLSLRP